MNTVMYNAKVRQRVHRKQLRKQQKEQIKDGANQRWSKSKMEQIKDGANQRWSKSKMEQIKVEEAEWAHEECRCKSIAIGG
jgi:hypothetical protein